MPHDNKVYTPSYFSVVKKRINSTFSSEKLDTQESAKSSANGDAVATSKDPFEPYI